MKSYVGLLLFSVFAFGLVAAAEEAKPLSCDIGGYKLGMDFPGRLKRGEYRSSTSHVFDTPNDARTFKLKYSSGNFTDYLTSSGGKVVAVVREFDAEDLSAFVKALKETYGEPLGGNGSEVKGLGTIVSVKERLVWPLEQCHANLEIVKRTRKLGTLVTEFYGLVLRPTVGSVLK